jgi:8-oxo-dGTP pyrophosphatase MutT (NUDIX family)
MTVAEARPAAAVIVARGGARHGSGGLEVLLARRNSDARFMPDVWVFPGGAVSPPDHEGAPEDDDGEEAHRRAAVRELQEEVGVDLPAGELLAWSRWITPEVAPVRFDTRFYVIRASAHLTPKPDDAEITEVRWVAPSAALAAHREGDFKLVFPTIKHLEGLEPYANADELVAAAAERVVEPILPRVIGTEESWRVVLPGDPDY